MTIDTRTILSTLSLLAVLASCAGSTPARQPRLDVRIVPDEAAAALAILARRDAGETPTADDWERLWTSEGYRRLARREAAMGRAFSDDDFREFLLSDTLADRHAVLAETLEEWVGADVGAAARRALAYLPAGGRLEARLYPVVKPRSNSFVFDLGTDSAAIFLYLDPEVDRAKLENTLAHELHHVGYAAACEGDGGPAPSERVETATRWMSAFGEGLAMLAAAGGPEVHPHAVSDAGERERWDRSMARLEADMRQLEEFFLGILEGRLARPDSVRSAGMGFFGVQGPWYTVGWTMAATIERAYGRERLVGVICEPRRLLVLYNRAAAALGASDGQPPPRWSEELVSRLTR